MEAMKTCITTDADTSTMMKSSTLLSKDHL